ncbi:hypothetical protein Pfo_006993, partial [Paulownia fortunei]
MRKYKYIYTHIYIYIYNTNYMRRPQSVVLVEKPREWTFPYKWEVTNIPIIPSWHSPASASLPPLSFTHSNWPFQIYSPPTPFLRFLRFSLLISIHFHSFVFLRPIFRLKISPL